MRSVWCLVAALCLFLAACNEKPAESGAAGENGTDRPATATSGSDHIGKLANLVTSEQGISILDDWGVRDWPPVLIRSLETEYEIENGTKYQLFDYNKVPSNLCTVYVSANQTPAILVFYADWLAEKYGTTVNDLIKEFNELYSDAEQKPVTFPLVGVPAEHRRCNIGDADLEMGISEPDRNGAISVLFRLTLHEDVLAKLSDSSRKYPELLEYAGSNTPATLTEICGLLGDEGALGILGRYNFEDFEFAEQYWPAHAPDPKFEKQITYRLGKSIDIDDMDCGLTAEDHGESARFAFTADWYEQANGISADDLSAEFDSIWARHNGSRTTVDSDDESLRMEFSAVDFDGTYITRRSYISAGETARTFYTLASPQAEYEQLEMREITNADWTKLGSGLPEDGGGKFEKFLRELATTNGIEFANKIGMIHEESRGGPVSGFNQLPFSYINAYLIAPDMHPDWYCDMGVLDGTFLQMFNCDDQWLCWLTGAGLDEQLTEIIALAKRMNAKVTEETREGKDATVYRFKYGRLGITYTVTYGDPDAFYISILPSTWFDRQ